MLRRLIGNTYFNGGSLAKLRFQVDAAAVALDQPLADGQAQARALAGRFGREEGLEDLLQRLRRDAFAGVLHDQLEHLAPVALAASGLERQLLGVGAGLQRVDRVVSEV